MQHQNVLMIIILVVFNGMIPMFTSAESTVVDSKTTNRNHVQNESTAASTNHSRSVLNFSRSSWSAKKISGTNRIVHPPTNHRSARDTSQINDTDLPSLLITENPVASSILSSNRQQRDPVQLYDDIVNTSQTVSHHIIMANQSGTDTSTLRVVSDQSTYNRLQRDEVHTYDILKASQTDPQEIIRSNQSGADTTPLEVIADQSTSMPPQVSYNRLQRDAVHPYDILKASQTDPQEIITSNQSGTDTTPLEVITDQSTSMPPKVSYNRLQRDAVHSYDILKASQTVSQEIIRSNQSGIDTTPLEVIADQSTSMPPQVNSNRLQRDAVHTYDILKTSQTVSQEIIRSNQSGADMTILDVISDQSTSRPPQVSYNRLQRDAVHPYDMKASQTVSQEIIRSNQSGTDTTPFEVIADQSTSMPPQVNSNRLQSPNRLERDAVQPYDTLNTGPTRNSNINPSSKPYLAFNDKIQTGSQYPFDLNTPDNQVKMYEQTQIPTNGSSTPNHLLTKTAATTSPDQPTRHISNRLFQDISITNFDSRTVTTPSVKAENSQQNATSGYQTLPIFSTIKPLQSNPVVTQSRNSNTQYQAINNQSETDSSSQVLLNMPQTGSQKKTAVNQSGTGTSPLRIISDQSTSMPSRVSSKQIQRGTVQPYNSSNTWQVGKEDQTKTTAPLTISTKRLNTQTNQNAPPANKNTNTDKSQLLRIEFLGPVGKLQDSIIQVQILNSKDSTKNGFVLSQLQQIDHSPTTKPHRNTISQQQQQQLALEKMQENQPITTNSDLYMVESQNGDLPVSSRATTDQYQSSSSQTTAHPTYRLGSTSQTFQYLKGQPKLNPYQTAIKLRPGKNAKGNPQIPKRKTPTSGKQIAINYLLKKFYEEVCLTRGNYVDDFKYVALTDTCDTYVRCMFFNERVVYYNVLKCPYGYFWENSEAACKEADKVSCWANPCQNKAIRNYAEPSNCRAHWTCRKKRPFPKCCPRGMSFHPTNGCHHDINCNAACPQIATKSSRHKCNKLSDEHLNWLYLEYISGKGYQCRSCPLGADFNKDTCACTFRVFQQLIQGIQTTESQCRLDVYLNFSYSLNDISGNHIIVSSENVGRQNGRANFNGMSKIVIWRLRGAPIGQNFIIQLRFKPKPNARRFNIRKEHLISNCGRRITPSIDVFLSPQDNFIHFAVKTTDSKLTLKGRYKISSWNDVELHYNGEHLTGKINGIVSSQALTGNVVAKPTSLLIGFCSPQNAFHGWIEHVKIYFCGPSPEST